MSPKVRIPLFTLCALNAAIPATAGDLRESLAVPADAKSAPQITAPETASRWRIGAGYAPVLGLEAKFEGLGRFRSPFSPQPLGGGTDYDYDDGFVHVDSSGNLGGLTWNWGYQHDSQYNPSGNGSIAMSITNSLATGSTDERGAAENGWEVFGYYDMGRLAFAPFKAAPAGWGFCGGLQYARVNLGNGDSLATALVTTTDHFGLGGQVPPSAPYEGSYFGPGVLLDDAPTRTTTIGGQGLVVGSRELDADLFITRFGGYLQAPVTGKFSLMAEAGVNLGIASGSYEFHSATTVAGLGTQQSHGSDSTTSLLPGVYAGLSGLYRLDDHWSVQGGARYQYLKPLELGANGSDATLSFDQAFVLSLNVVYSF